MIKKVQNTLRWTYIVNDVNGEEIVGTFYENKLQKTKRNLELKKIIKRKGDKLNV